MLGVRLTRLGAAELVFNPAPSRFVVLTASILGNAADPSDGFDAALLAVAQDLAGESAGFPSLDQDLAVAGFNPGDFEAGNSAPVAQDSAGFIGDTDPAVGELLTDTGQVITPPPPPTPPTPPPEPVGGGGEGGGGGGGGGGLDLCYGGEVGYVPCEELLGG